MDEQVAKEIIEFILSEKNKWTVIVSSSNKQWRANCTREIIMNNGEIVKDLKK
jgi:ABC-type polysaccharide/polyol phosphate transport system ATPase subunit